MVIPNVAHGGMSRIGNLNSQKHCKGAKESMSSRMKEEKIWRKHKFHNATKKVIKKSNKNLYRFHCSACLNFELLARLTRQPEINCQCVREWDSTLKNCFCFAKYNRIEETVTTFSRQLMGILMRIVFWELAAHPKL